MSAIPFTDRELRRAWRDLSVAAQPPAESNRQNPHRLLLFYAVECGLKAVWLKRQRRSLFEAADIHQTGHDLQQLLKNLAVGSNLSLPDSFQLLAVSSQATASLPRQGRFGDVHQAWRYGGKCQVPTDQDCERQLLNVLAWIQGELK